MSAKLNNLSLSAVEQSNMHHLVRDVAWFGLAAAATSRFLSVYAIRLGADATALSLLTAIPALILLMSSTFAGMWVSRFKSVKGALLIPSIGFRLVFLLPAFAPFVPQKWQAPYLIFAASLPAVVQGLAATAFVVLMRSAVQDTMMPALLSRRSIAMNLTVAIGALGFGYWLEQATFPQNYQIMFLFAFFAAMMSVRHVMHVDCSPNPCPLVSPQVTGVPKSAASPWRSPNFRRVAMTIMIAYIAYFSVYALVPLHLVNDLHATEGFIALYGIVELGAGAAVGTITSRVAARVGNRTMIALAMIGTALSTLIVALSPSLPFTLLAAGIAGASWTTVAMIGLFSYFTENTPPEHMSTYGAAYHQVLGLAMFIGPLVGSLLSRSGLDLITVLLIGSALRFVAAPLMETQLVNAIRKAGVAVLRMRTAE